MTPPLGVLDPSCESRSHRTLSVDHTSIVSKGTQAEDKWLRMTLPYVLKREGNSFNNRGHTSKTGGGSASARKETLILRRATRYLHFPLSLPTVEFPNQGHGTLSEFFVKCPPWTIEPLRSIYTIVFIAFMLFFYLPFKALMNIPRANRPRRSWSWTKAMLVSITRRCTVYICKTHILLAGSPSEKEPVCRKSKFVWIDPADLLEPATPETAGDIRGELKRAMQLQSIKPARISGFFVAATGAPIPTDERACEDERLIVHLHGGAYWMGTANESSVGAVYCRDLLGRMRNSVDVPRRAFLVEYRLARHTNYRHGSYPAALLDSFLAYLYVVRTCGFKPENIILSGDSSGGNLALALCRYLRDEGIESVPGSLILLSPWCDISRSHSGPLPAPNPFSTTVLNGHSDIITPSLLYRNSAVCALLGCMPASEAYTNPYISPVSLQLDPQADVRPPHWGFAGFPKHVFINTGNAELNYEQHITLAHRMAEGTLAGVPKYSGDCAYSADEAHMWAWREQFPRTEKWVSEHDSAMNDPPPHVEPFEERYVVLDEVRDGVHVYPMFTWFEPERSQTLDRIAAWIEREPELRILSP